MNNQIKIDDLDFSAVKENLKNYLRGQSELADYDFEASVLQTLLDVLAYNTHYNAMYMNMALNEMFLDSASKYSSIVSIAKMLGYTAKSITSAKGLVNITVTKTTGINQALVLPKNTVFNGKLGNEYFQFVTKDDSYAGADGTGVYRFYNVELIEGSIIQKRYDVSGQNDQFVVPSEKADITTLNVRVQDSASSSNYTTFGKSIDFLTVRADSNVYFVKQREDLYYEVYFGNGQFGAALSPGNVVHLDYVLSLGDKANGAGDFSYSSGFDADFESILVETAAVAWGGTQPESVDSIKFNAPKSYTASERAVTAEDFHHIILANFPQIESAAVWGGQNMNPPQFGKIFIAVKPKAARKISNAQKTEIENFLIAKKQIISVTPVILDTKFLKVNIQSSVYFNRNHSRKSPGELDTLIRSNVAKYGASLGKFSSIFRQSRLSSIIDLTDKAITSNITSVSIDVEVDPILNKKIRYKFSIGNPIYRNSGGQVRSTSFRINSSAVTDLCFIQDDGAGVLKLFDSNNTFISDVGTVDYGTGEIDIKELNLRNLPGLFQFRIKPLSNDIVPNKQFIIEIGEVTLSILEDASSGENSINKNYVFTSSH